MKVGVLLSDPVDQALVCAMLKSMSHKAIVYESEERMCGELLYIWNSSHRSPLDLLIMDVILEDKQTGMQAIDRLYHTIPTEKMRYALLLGESEEERQLLEEHSPKNATIINKPKNAGHLLKLLKKQEREQQEADFRARLSG